jgi:thiol-disulfide isomerase/thioredoxin
MNVRDLIAVFSAGCLAITSACDQNHDTEADAAPSEHAQDSRIVVGAELPDFALSSLDDSNVVYTRADLAGKIYLIDFWATWCLPCVAELPNLQSAYEKYRSRGFEILSVAMGDRREEIARLRQTDLTMPWMHAFEPLDSKAAELFEVFGVPKAILVDSSNTIIGLDEDVRGQHLQETLSRLFDGGD